MKPIIIESTFAYDKKADADLFEQFNTLSLVLACADEVDLSELEETVKKGNKYRITVEEVNDFTPLNSFSTTELDSMVHRSKDGLRSLCGKKVVFLNSELLAALKKAVTCGDVLEITDCEPCIDCNAVNQK